MNMISVEETNKHGLNFLIYTNYSQALNKKPEDNLS